MPNHLYKFINHSMATDEIDPKTNKVKKHKEINVTSDSEEDARKKGKVEPEWELVSIHELSKDWKY